MAKVILRNHWYAPNEQLFRKSVTKKGPPVDISDELVPYLPSMAKIVSDDYVTPEPGKSADTLSEHRKMLDANDPSKAAAMAEIAVFDKAQKFQAELAAEVAEAKVTEAAAEATKAEAEPAKPRKKR